MKALEHIQDIGSMDEVIDILQPYSTRNEYGEEILNYIRIAQVFAAFDFRSSGSESIETGQLTAHHTAQATIRYYSGIQEKWRVVRRADMTDWDIQLITDTGRQRFMNLTLTHVT